MKYAEDLAKEYEVECFYHYIVDSLINGQRDQVRNLFNELHNDDQKYFLTTFLDVRYGYHKSTLNICIGELLK